jgi:hypothetical protein
MVVERVFRLAVEMEDSSVDQMAVSWVDRWADETVAVWVDVLAAGMVLMSVA